MPLVLELQDEYAGRAIQKNLFDENGRFGDVVGTYVGRKKPAVIWRDG